MIHDLKVLCVLEEFELQTDIRDFATLFLVFWDASPPNGWSRLLKELELSYFGMQFAI